MSYWQSLRSYFEEDDGSLPELEIAFHDPSHTCLAFENLNKKAKANITVGGPSLWSRKEDKEIPYSFNGAVELVCSGEAESFHIVLRGIEHNGITLPDLGIFVSPNEITLDYRMGQEWNEPSVTALISLLSELCSVGGKLSAPWWRDFPGAETLFRIAVAGSHQ